MWSPFPASWAAFLLKLPPPFESSPVTCFVFMTFLSKSPRAACKSQVFKTLPPTFYLPGLPHFHGFSCAIFFFVFVIECVKLQQIYAYQVLFQLPQYYPRYPARRGVWGPTSAVYGYLGAGTKFPPCSCTFFFFFYDPARGIRG